MTPEEQIIINQIHNDLKIIKHNQDEGFKRLITLEQEVKSHLNISNKNAISKKEKIYFALGLIGSYGLGIITTILK